MFVVGIKLKRNKVNIIGVFVDINLCCIYWILQYFRNYNVFYMCLCLVLMDKYI